MPDGDVVRSSRAWFEWVRSCSAYAARSKERLQELEAAEGPRAQTYEPVGHGGTSDPTAATDRRIDYEAERGRSEGEWYRAFDRAGELLYGPGGVADGLGTGYAEVVDLYYVDALTWREVSERTRYSVRWCHEMATRAFEWLDLMRPGKKSAQ